MARRSKKPLEVDDNPYLRSRAPSRPLAEACRLAGLPLPESAEAVAATYWALLLAGTDHQSVGTWLWLEIICGDAPLETPSGVVRCRRCRGPVAAPPEFGCGAPASHAPL